MGVAGNLLRELVDGRFLEPGLLGGIGSGEIVVLLVVVLLLFGPRELPNIARTIGNALKGIRKATDEVKQEIGLDEMIHPGRRSRAGPYRPAGQEKRAERPAGGPEDGGARGSGTADAPPTPAAEAPQPPPDGVGR